MCNQNSWGGGNCCWIIIVILLLFFCCGSGSGCGLGFFTLAGKNGHHL